MMRFSGVWYWVLIAIVVVLAASITILFGEANDVPVLEETNSPDTLKEADPGTEVKLQPEDAVPRGTTVNVDTSNKVELQQLFNELRKEYLDTRAKSIDWWLEFIAIFLTIFAVVIAIAGFIGFTEFRRLRNEAESDADKIKNHLSNVLESSAEFERVREETEVSEVGTESDEAMQMTRETLSAEVFASNDEEFENNLRDFEQIPNLSFVDKAMVEAYKLQKDSRIEEAIRQWRSIANSVDETEKDLAARAWNSIGYLLSELERTEEAISAYDKAIEMKADYTDAYCNRGEQKIELSQYSDAIEDLNKAISLNPNEAKVYMVRGIAKFELDEHDDAFTDFDKTISLKPDFALAHANRGSAKAVLNDIGGAKVDLQNALGLAKQQSEKELMDEIEKYLQELNETE